MSDLKMTKAERETFLADTHVAVISVNRTDRGPYSVPIWYRYAAGGAVEIVTGASSLKTRLIRAGGRFTLCTQTEAAPYKYVTVEGPAAISTEIDFDRHLREVAHRYLGPEIGEAYVNQMHPGDEIGDNVLITLTPEHWTTIDYTKM